MWWTATTRRAVSSIAASPRQCHATRVCPSPSNSTLLSRFNRPSQAFASSRETTTRTEKSSSSSKRTTTTTTRRSSTLESRKRAAANETAEAISRPMSRHHTLSTVATTTACHRRRRRRRQRHRRTSTIKHTLPAAKTSRITIRPTMLLASRSSRTTKTTTTAELLLAPGAASRSRIRAANRSHSAPTSTTVTNRQQ